jgi:hypothetical protein|tara:strand:+ start:1370 stop:1732 length:363 start_codon:yes stop_codon:yes gene_type:complete
MSKARREDSTLVELKARFESLRNSLASSPWILQGSVNEKPPPPDSTSARTTYTWTRKLRGKTATVALSPQQARAFQRAIAANRRLEKKLEAMREITQKALTESLPGVKKTRDSKKARNEV